MRAIDGYSFKENLLSPTTRKFIDNSILAFEENNNHAYSYKHKDSTYIITREMNLLHVYGIGTRENNDTICILWGTNAKTLNDVVYNISAGRDIFPYKIATNVFYNINNGEIFETSIGINSKVSTPQGNGIIRTIDDAICVELESDQSVLYEFDIHEIQRIKEEN